MRQESQAEDQQDLFLIQIAAKVQKGEASREEMQAAMDLASARIKLMKTQAHLAGLNAALTGFGAASEAGQGIKSSHTESDSIGNDVAAVGDMLFPMPFPTAPYGPYSSYSSNSSAFLPEVDSAPYGPSSSFSSFSSAFLLEVDSAPSSDTIPHSDKTAHEKTSGDDLFLLQTGTEVHRAIDARCVRKMIWFLCREEPNRGMVAD